MRKTSFKNKTTYVAILAILAIGLTMIPMLTDEAMAAKPGDTGGGNPAINHGAINYEDGTASATGSLVGAPKNSGPYEVVGSLDLSTTTSNTKTVGPNDRVIEPKGLQSEQEINYVGSATYTQNENKFEIPLTTDDTTSEGKTPNERAGFTTQTSSEVVGSSLTLNGVEQEHSQPVIGGQ